MNIEDSGGPQRKEKPMALVAKNKLLQYLQGSACWNKLETSVFYESVFCLNSSKIEHITLFFSYSDVLGNDDGSTKDASV